jgi:hypothetical protein
MPHPGRGRRARPPGTGLPVALLGLFCLLVLAPDAVASPRHPLTPRHLETPSFVDLPAPASSRDTVRGLMADLRSEAGAEFLRRWSGPQGRVIGLSILVALLVAFDFRRPRHPRHLDLLLMAGIGVLLFDGIRLLDLLDRPVYLRVTDWIFTAVFVLSAVLLGRAVWRIRRPYVDPWRPNLSRPFLMGLTGVLFVTNVWLGVAREPDDAGFYTNLGAQRLRERGAFPYGDPLLDGTPAAAYGPVLYLAHLPFQILIQPKRVNASSPDPPEIWAGDFLYYLPPVLATQLTTVAFHLLAVGALVVAGRQLAGPAVGWGLAALYCGSPFVLGVGGERDLIGGMTFISHIAPAAATLLAFIALSKPVLSGFALAAAAATLFYPVFFVPAWLGYYSRDRRALLMAIGGMVLAALVIGGPVLLRSQPAGDRGLIGTVMHNTLGHQEDPEGYGASPFGFWGQRGGVRGLLGSPLLDGQPLTRPVMLAFLGFVAAGFFIARGRSRVQLALLIAALAIGANLIKVHGTGVYVAWYYPFLLLGIVAGRHRSSHLARPEEDEAGRLDRTATLARLRAACSHVGRPAALAILTFGLALSFLAIAPVWAVALLIVLMAWAVAPGVLLAAQVYGWRQETRGAVLLLGPIWGFGLTSVGLLGLWVTGIRHPVLLALAPALAGVAVLAARQWLSNLLVAPVLTRRDITAVLLALLLVPLVAGLPYARVGEEVADGRAYRAYFTADFVWSLAVVAEVSKGAVPPRNQFLAGEDLHYYWLPFLLSSIEYRTLGDRLAIERIVLVNGLLCGLLLVGFLYGFTRHFVSSPGAALLGCVAVVLFTSFEGLERLLVIWKEMLPLATVRILNIDAVTRWFYGTIPADGLHRLLLYQPQHHAMAYATGLSALLVLRQAKQPWRPAVATLAGSFLALNMLLGAFSALMLTVMTAAFGLWLLASGRETRRGWPRAAIAGALPLAAAFLITRHLAYVDPSQSFIDLMTFVNPRTVSHPFLGLFLNFGPVAMAAAAGTALAARRRVTSLAVPTIVVGVSLVFFFCVDVIDHQHVYVGWRAGHLIFIACAPLVALAVQELWHQGTRARRALAAGGTVLALTAAPTTVIDLYNAQDITNRAEGPGFPWTLVLTYQELEGLDWIRRSTPADAHVQVEPILRTPASWSYIPSFAERRMVGGLPISMVPLDKYELPAQRMRRVYRALDPETAHDTAARNGVDYLVIGPDERATYPKLEPLLNGRPDLFRRRFSNAAMTIYELKQPYEAVQD